ncbi:MAG: hypothetical protein HZB25_02955 [Candidatus Eisenbacteria bacterium]|nr:hypothetical protein [Candidatus Eisenbacteria bacterium]
MVHVGGPKGAGKTTFIEALLGRSLEDVIAVRCIRDDTLRGPRESAPRSDPELLRYRRAGAAGAGRFGFPRSDSNLDAFFMTLLMEDYSEAVVLEGDNPLEFVDLVAFVATGPHDGESLFVRCKRDRAGEAHAKADAMERLLRKPGGVAELLGQMLGPPFVELARRNPAMLEDARNNLLDTIEAARKSPPPHPTEHWAISERFAGIEHAQLVVVNICDDAERTRGERLLADLAQLRKDESLFSDILGFRGSRTPVTAVVANLADPGDPGRKKAVARARRAFRARLQ